MSNQKSSEEAIKILESRVTDYINYFSDTYVPEYHVIVKVYPKFQTKLYVPNSKENFISSEGTVVKVGDELPEDLIGKTAYWDSDRNPVSMLNRVKVDEFNDEEIPLSASFLVLHKNIITYIK